MGSLGVKLADMAEQKLAPDLMKKVWSTAFSMQTAMKQSQGGTVLHDILTKQFHPEVEKETVNVLNFAKQNGSNMSAGEIRGQAKQIARERVFGKNDEIIQGLVKHIEKQKGTDHAQNIVDHLNVHLADAPQVGGRFVGQSRLDKNLQISGGNKYNVFNVQHPTVYEPVGSVEKTLKTYQAAAFAAKAAIPHAATQLNVALNDGFSNYLKAVTSVITPFGFDSAKQMLIAHNAVAELHLTEYEQEQAFKNGKIKNYAPGSIGAFVQRNFAMPGMSALRKWTVTVAGMSSKFSAEEAAVRYANGDHSVLPVLRELNLDPNKILNQQGKLLPEDYNKALYHGINNSVFLGGESGLHRTRAAQSTMLGRLTTAFHTYTTRQAQLIKGVLQRDLIDRKDPIAAARTLAMLGVVFPTVGNAVYSLERLSRGQDWDGTAGDKFKHREAAMYGADGFVDAFLNHIESIASTASFGVATSYGRGVFRSHLANQLLGPVGNTAITTIEDIGKEGTELYKENVGDKKKSYGAEKQLMRDAIQATPMAGFNTAAKHLLLPTRAEEEAGKPKTAKQMKAALRRRMKKNSTQSGKFFDNN